MEGHTRSWDAVAADMTRTLGERFEPEWKEGLHERIVRQLTHELPQLDQTTIGKAVDRAVGEVRFPIDWRRFLCFLLYHLPGQWVKVANNPGFGASTMLLLTDGTVMVQEEGGVRWKKLTPDAHGSYVNGTWSDLAPMHHTRRYYASAVLRDGRVLVSGGEYSDAGSETNATEMYDPVNDTWTEISAPTGWSRIGDSPLRRAP